MTNTNNKPIPLRFKDKDTPFGVTRETAEKFADALGASTLTAAIHFALARVCNEWLSPEEGKTCAPVEVDESYAREYLEKGLREKIQRQRKAAPAID